MLLCVVDKYSEEVRRLCEDKALLMSEMKHMQTQYTQLNDKLDQAHSLITDRQVRKKYTTFYQCY